MRGGIRVELTDPDEMRTAAARKRRRRRSGMLNVLVLSSIALSAVAICVLSAVISEKDVKLGESCCRSRRPEKHGGEGQLANGFPRNRTTEHVPCLRISRNPLCSPAK